MTRFRTGGTELAAVQPLDPRANLRAAQVIGRSFRCAMHAHQSGDGAAWAYAWQEFASVGEARDADTLVTHLDCFAQTVASTSARRIEVLPKGCPGLCRDECLAVSIITASQLGACPALKACAFALLDSSNVAPCLSAATSFGEALRACGHELSADLICNALAFMPRSGHQAAHDA